MLPKSSPVRLIFFVWTSIDCAPTSSIARYSTLRLFKRDENFTWNAGYAEQETVNDLFKGLGTRLQVIVYVFLDTQKTGIGDVNMV